MSSKHRYLVVVGIQVVKSFIIFPEVLLGRLQGIHGFVALPIAGIASHTRFGKSLWGLEK